ncbi:class II aldolase/adducin family protein [Sporosarcina sp. CAU 1771]
MNSKKEICRIAKKGAALKLVAGTSGNVSYYDREKELLYITPSNLEYDAMTAEDIVEMDLDGNVRNGDKIPSSEWRLHAGIYKNHPRFNAVYHTHSPYATSFSVIGEGIPIILVEMIPYLGGDVPLAPFGLPGTDDLPNSVLQPLENRNACLLENHGVVVAGKDLEQVLTRAIYVEDAAEIYHKARSIGKANLVPRDGIQKMGEKYGYDL